ncbi:sugar phosphate isomerase/epimerase [Schumannella soli]|uniref:Sugar phosphate isomerase/epimerase n=2 Tax=Schumannella soli TaxID=2590779 RepID=A0A506XWV1_9MICO|nr:sugar phosphate isomerase/epimerase [Schumannella soli]
MMLKGSIEERGAFATLQRVRDIGYRAIEISQIPLTTENVDELVRARDELGFEFSSTSASLDKSTAANDALETDFEKIVADTKRLGASMVRMGMMPLGALADLDSLHAFCDAAEGYAQRLEEQGLHLYYHNHHVEFAKYDGRYALDIIADRSPTVGIELDAHWLQRGGVDPQRTIERFAGRVKMVHLKDYRIGQLPSEAFELLEKGDHVGFMGFFTSSVQFAEVGEGNLDWKGIIPASIAAGAEYLLVEQDQLYGRDVFDCLQTSHDNLVAMGFADLF